MTALVTTGLASVSFMCVYVGGVGTLQCHTDTAATAMPGRTSYSSSVLKNQDVYLMARQWVFGKLPVDLAVSSCRVWTHPWGSMLAFSQTAGPKVTFSLRVMTPAQGPYCFRDNTMCKEASHPGPLELWPGDADQQYFLGRLLRGFMSLVLRWEP